MKNFYLDFEKPISDIMDKIEALKIASEDDPKLIPEIEKLKTKEKNLRKRIFSKLSIWQKVQIARHPQRPHTKDYIDLIFSNFVELHGDRQYADDAAIIGGIGDIDKKSFMIIGHEKGRETEEKVRRNFGMPHPEGYRKAKRLMLLAERFSLPIISFIDTAGAYPGIEGEERGQSEAIASNLALMSKLKTQILVFITGEGGSGGALGIGVGDHYSILEHATYSVASPEACASIVWRSSDKAEDAADAMKLTSKDLIKLKIIDEVIEEPIGGAHRDYKTISSHVKQSLLSNIENLNKISLEKLLERRYSRLTEVGR